MISDEQRAEIVAALAELREVFGKLSATLSADDRFAASLATGIRGGTSVRALLDESQIATIRRELTDLAAELSHARLRARLALASALQSEGMSIGQIARTFGISRQLASRMLQEGAAGTGPEAAQASEDEQLAGD